MSNLSNSTGDGGGGGRPPGNFSDTGYGTHDGQGNAPTGAQYQKGTGYDDKGQVVTSFGKWPVAYDPVTGMAVENVTAGYDMAGADVGGGGLVDVSAAASEHAAVATPELQQAVQQFFASRETQGGQGQQPGSAGHAAEEQPGQPQAGEGTGEGEAGN